MIGGIEVVLAASVDEKTLDTGVRWSGGMVVRMRGKIGGGIHGGKEREKRDSEWREH